MNSQPLIRRAGLPLTIKTWLMTERPFSYDIALAFLLGLIFGMAASGVVVYFLTLLFGAYGYLVVLLTASSIAGAAVLALHGIRRILLVPRR